MKLITKNPYRIIGVTANANARTFQKQKAKMTTFAKVGKEITSDYDFKFLEEVARSNIEVDRAFVDLEHNQNKIHYALFWFVEITPFDSTALEWLKNGASQKGASIWRKLTNDKLVTKQNYSAFNNLGTLCLLNDKHLPLGIQLKTALIESPYLQTFAQEVVDKTVAIEPEKQLTLFIKEIQKSFSVLSSQAFLALFDGCSQTVKKQVSNILTEAPAQRIEQAVHKSKQQREQDSRSANQFGLDLYDVVAEDLVMLQTLLGKDSPSYQLVADKIAEELNQCAIDYFKARAENGDPSIDAQKLLNYAKLITVSQRLKQQLEETLADIREWKEFEPVRRYADSIVKRINDLGGEHSYILGLSKVSQFLDGCWDDLSAIEQQLGKNDDYYNLSSAVVNNALNKIIDCVNKAQDDLSNRLIAIEKLKEIIDKSLALINRIGLLDMHDGQYEHYLTNKETLENISEQLSESIKGTQYMRTMQEQVWRMQEAKNINKQSTGNSGCLWWFIGGIVFLIFSALLDY